MKKSLLITVFISCTSFSLPSHAYKHSIFLENSNVINSIIMDDFKLNKNISLTNSFLMANGGSVFMFHYQ